MTLQVLPRVDHGLKNSQMTWPKASCDPIASSFQIASYLTDPICKAHELFRRLQIVDVLNPTATKAANLAKKIFLVVGMLGYAGLASVTTLPSVVLRTLAIHAQKDPFLAYKTVEKGKTLLHHSFSLLSWNICCPAGGYAISDGGVMPWTSRIDAIVDKIAQKNADVNCLYETFDTCSAFYLKEKLKLKGYSRFYFNIGPKPIGVSSGMFVASKYDIAKPQFIPFPQDALVGRTKNLAKGVFSFDLQSKGKSFAHILATHFQHSEECIFPTQEEKDARKKEMEILLDRVAQIRNRCIVVTGDLNLDDEEYHASSWRHRFKKGDLYKDPHRTWGGDEFCAHLVGKRPSSPLNFDHTMLVKGTASHLTTSLVNTGFDGKKFHKDALSDHAGLFSTISLWREVI